MVYGFRYWFFVLAHLEPEAFISVGALIEAF